MIDHWKYSTSKTTEKKEKQSAALLDYHTRTFNEIRNSPKTTRKHSFPGWTDSLHPESSETEPDCIGPASAHRTSPRVKRIFDHWSSVSVMFHHVALFVFLLLAFSRGASQRFETSGLAYEKFVVLWDLSVDLRGSHLVAGQRDFVLPGVSSGWPAICWPIHQVAIVWAATTTAIARVCERTHSQIIWCVSMAKKKQGSRNDRVCKEAG